jgi:hypothetical protein
LTQAGPGGGRVEGRYEDRAADLVCKVLRAVPEEKRLEYWRANIQAEPALQTIRRHPKVLRLAPPGAR